MTRAWIPFRYLSSYSRWPQWSVRTCIKIFLSYSVHCWKHRFHKAFRYLNISMYFCIPLARTPSSWIKTCSLSPAACSMFENVSPLCFKFSINQEVHIKMWYNIMVVQWLTYPNYIIMGNVFYLNSTCYLVQPIVDCPSTFFCPNCLHSFKFDITDIH